MAVVSEIDSNQASSRKKRKPKVKKSSQVVAPPLMHGILLKPHESGAETAVKVKESKQPNAILNNQVLESKRNQKKKRKFTAADCDDGGETKLKKKNRTQDFDVKVAAPDVSEKNKVVLEHKSGSRFQKPLKQKKHSKHKDLRPSTVEMPTKNVESAKGYIKSKSKLQLQGKKRKADESHSSESGAKNQKTEQQKLVELSKKERKLVRKTTKNNYELAMKAKKLWEVLRNHEKSKDEAKKGHLCQQLHNLIKGKVNELIYAHDTSRVIECLLAMGNVDIRTALFEELKGQTLKLAKCKYSKFFVLKLLKYGTKEQRNELIASVYGHVVKLIIHTEAANVLEEMYNEYATAHQRTAMVEEFYGPSFQLFKDNEIRTLDQVLTKDPSKKDTILGYMKEILMKLLDKPVLGHSMVHHVIYEYITHCADKDRAELIESLRDSLAQIVHTRDGSRIAMHCIWHGTAKDRKLIIKSFKTHVVKICKEEHGHMVLMAIFDVVDDTRLVHKALIDEMLQSLKDVIFDQHGRKVILHLLSPRNTAYHHPDIIKLLQHGDGNAHSKKDKDVRSKELLATVSPQLTNVFAESVKEIISTPAASIVAQAIIKHGLSGDPNIVYKKIAELVAEPLISEKKGASHILEDPAGHMLLKCLIKEDKRRAENDNTSSLFCHHLLETVPQSAYRSWIECNRATFILVNILETGIQEITDNVKGILDPLEKHIAKKPFKGAKILISKL